MQSTSPRKIRKASEIPTPAVLAAVQPPDPLNIRPVVASVFEPALETILEAVAAPHKLAPLETTKGLAEYLSVSPATVDELVRQGLPHVWVLDRRRFDVTEVKVWLAERRRKQDEGAL